MCISHMHTCVYTHAGEGNGKKERRVIHTDREEGKMTERGGERDLRIEKSKAQRWAS